MLVLLSAICLAYGQDDKPTGPKKVANADVAARTFDQAKDLIGANNWPAAAQKLSSMLSEHRNSKYYEPGLYWLAYVRKRQGQYQDAFRLINSFILQFPHSRWEEDAKTLRAELAAEVQNVEVIAEELRNTNNNEVKLAALSSLLQLDSARGLGHATEILNSEANRANRILREGVITLIGQYGGNETDAVLMGIAQRESEEEVIRTAAIFALRRHLDETVLARLTELAMKGGPPPVVEAALFVFIQQDNHWARELLVKIATNAQTSDTRRRAVNFLAKLKGGAAIDELINLYATSDDIQVKREVLSTLSKTGNYTAQARVLEISRFTDNMGIREEGILSLGEQGGDMIIAQLIQLYDAETREDVKALILSSLSKSRQKNALGKLVQVAEHEKSVLLKKKAEQLLRLRGTNPAP